jgi:hypothetical protein
MHAIRLRGPWEFSLSGTPASGRIEFPCDWPKLLSSVMSAGGAAVVPAEKAALTLRRHFHLPTGLVTGDRVWLVARFVCAPVAVQLNGTAIQLVEQSDGSHRADITDQLAPRNDLAIVVQPPSPAPIDSRDAVLEVALEIQSAL